MAAGSGIPSHVQGRASQRCEFSDISGFTSFSDDIHVYDVDDGTLLLGPLCHRGFVSEVQWSRDGSRLFSGSADTMIRCWNSDTGEQIRHPWTGHTDSICSLSTSPDGLIITSASHDHTVRFWDATTGNPIGPHLQYDTQVGVVRFSPSSEFVASAGWDGKISLWRVPRLNAITYPVITPFRCDVTPALIL